MPAGPADRCWDPSHLLPPHPLSLAEQRCCERGCHIAGSIKAWSECVSLPARLREARQAQLRARPDLRKRFTRQTGPGAASVLRTVAYDDATAELLALRVREG